MKVLTLSSLMMVTVEPETLSSRYRRGWWRKSLMVSLAFLAGCRLEPQFPNRSADHDTSLRAPRPPLHQPQLEELQRRLFSDLAPRGPLDASPRDQTLDAQQDDEIRASTATPSPPPTASIPIPPVSRPLSENPVQEIKRTPSPERKDDDQEMSQISYPEVLQKFDSIVTRFETLRQTVRRQMRGSRDPVQTKASREGLAKVDRALRRALKQLAEIERDEALRRVKVNPDGSLLSSDARLRRDTNRHIIIVYHFASWCRPCRTEIDIVKKFYHRNRERLNFYAISHDVNQREIERFFRHSERPELEFPPPYHGSGG